MTLSREITYELLAEADKYMLNRLKNICEEYLVNKLFESYQIGSNNIIEKCNRISEFSREI